MRVHIFTGDIEKAAGRLGAGPTTADKIALLQSVEDGIQKSGNYVSVFNAGQNSWKPLTPKYVARKAKAGLSTKKWHLRGDSFEALTTPIKITTKTNKNIFGRELRVLSIGKKFRGTIRYSVGAPAATGWPGHRAKRSYFTKNDWVRPFLSEITPKSEDAILDRMMDTVLAWMIRATS